MEIFTCSSNIKLMRKLFMIYFLNIIHLRWRKKKRKTFLCSNANSNYLQSILKMILLVTATKMDFPKLKVLSQGYLQWTCVEIGCFLFIYIYIKVLFENQRISHANDGPRTHNFFSPWKAQRESFYLLSICWIDFNQSAVNFSNVLIKRK